MISGIILKHFKTYKGINYIPISNGSNFCGLIGLNGIGKSSILEALDCFFNKKPWNKNVDANKSDLAYIVPIFILNESDFQDSEYASFVKKYSNAIKSFIAKDIPTTINAQRRILWESIKKQHEQIDLSEKYIVPIGIDENNDITLNICEDAILNDLIPESETEFEGEEEMEFEDEKEKEEKKKEERNRKIKNITKELYSFIITNTTYVYIPKDIEPERFVVFETNEIQDLIGTRLSNIVKQQLPKKTIDTLSENLKEFIDDLSEKLSGYKFQMRGACQKNLNSKDIYSLIIHDFFSKRELFKENEGKNIPLSQLSSGEKQQAIVSFIHGVVTEYRDNNSSLIVAIDEPESALHIALCYDQFEKLYQISEKCCQVIFSSHWYGFIPTITGGCIANIVKNESDKHSSLLFSTYKYREEIKTGIEHSKGKLPIDVALKSINDLIQSIVSSVINDNCYNWLICEGSSDKIYLEAYLKQELSSLKLRIVPVCKAKEVKKMYEHIRLAFEDLRDEIKGKVFLLVDTDAQFYDFDTSESSHLLCKRIVNDNDVKGTKLVNNQSNPKSPKTDIEDTLNGKVFNKVLNTFKPQYPDLLDFVTDNEKEEIASYYAMDLKLSDYEKLDDFFSKNHNENKVLLAQRYVKELNNADYIVPEWIEEIKNFFNNKK